MKPGLNEHGFLHDFGGWTPEVARTLAEREGIDLDARHWAVIHYLRDYYRQYQVHPSLHTMLREIGDELSPRRASGKTLEDLFPNGGCKIACRLAGLPRYFCHGC
jgi:tRNA 2-thiouridine synthesizing protein E